jgi:predicted phosphodiesterase
MADTHDNLPLIDKAIRRLNEENVEIVLHAGDYVSPFVIPKFKELKTKQDGEIKKAVVAEKERIIKKIEEAIPSTLVQRQGSIPFNRLVIEIKKRILEL